MKIIITPFFTLFLLIWPIEFSVLHSHQKKRSSCWDGKGVHWGFSRVYIHILWVSKKKIPAYFKESNLDIFFDHLKISLDNYFMLDNVYSERQWNKILGILLIIFSIKWGNLDLIWGYSTAFSFVGMACDESRLGSASLKTCISLQSEYELCSSYS